MLSKLPQALSPQILGENLKLPLYQCCTVLCSQCVELAWSWAYLLPVYTGWLATTHHRYPLRPMSQPAIPELDLGMSSSHCPEFISDYSGLLVYQDFIVPLEIVDDIQISARFKIIQNCFVTV